jgi:hypothetical protein
LSKKIKVKSPVRKLIFWIFFSYIICVLFLLFVSTFVPPSQNTVVIIARLPLSWVVAFIPWLLLIMIYQKNMEEATKIQKAIAPYLKYPKSKIAIMEAGLDYETVTRAVYNMATTNTDGFLGECHLEDFLTRRVN